jgi:23S rRNA (cytidine1920-2'-O)/16S rRNA (cytidine1409-2'-O)-methyltransferase
VILLKKRLDQLLYDHGYADSREKAKQLVRDGNVQIEGLSPLKPGMKIEWPEKITVDNIGIKYVSRGGLKLQKAIEVYQIILSDKVCLDIGASTGGFTDCMLKAGAKKVFAVDVGTDQLHPSLKINPHVINLEQINFRNIKFEMIGELVDFVTVDASFISLSKLIPSLEPFIHPETELIALVKPQFEAGPKLVSKSGIVRKSHTHINVLNEVLAMFQNNGWSCSDLDFSPITGPKGNIEFLAYCKQTLTTSNTIDIVKIVEAAHKNFIKGE